MFLNFKHLQNVKSKMNELFIATLSSFRAPDTYFKSNLLTPFGIYLDAVMVVDENRNPCQLNEYYNENSELETKNEKELKYSLKIFFYE